MFIYYGATIKTIIIVEVTVAQSIIEANAIKNFKAGSNKILDNGIVTLLKLLVIAVIFYVLYQVLVFLAVGDSFKDLLTALQTFESNPENVTQLKDAFVEFGGKAGLTLFLSGLLIAILNIIYSLASMRVFINSEKGKDTSLDKSLSFGFERLGVAVLFFLLVGLIVTGYGIIVGMLTVLLPPSLIVTIPLSVILFVMLIIRTLFASQILADDKKPKVTSIFETSKQLVKASSTPLVYYVLFSFAIIILASIANSIVTGVFGLRPSNEYNLTTNYWDVFYASISFVVTTVIGFFITAGWVEIYTQAKKSLSTSSKNHTKN